MGTLWVALAGGLLAGLAAFFIHRRELALGLAWGSIFNMIQFLSLKILTEKMMGRGELEGRKFFWFWNSFRWLYLAVGCWWFLSVSPLCLAGAGLSYFWFLVLLGLAGWRSPSGIVGK